MSRFSDHVLPLVIEPPEPPEPRARYGLLEYAKQRKRELGDALQRHGALLFRGFAVEDAHAFEAIVRCFAPDLRSYQGGDSPRTSVTDKIYTSTSYPSSLPIPLHNEMSYTRDYPSLIAFYCEVPPAAGGETPLADCRRALNSLSPATLERFKIKKIRYIQNLPDGAGIGKSWRATFETDDREQVEAILRARGAELQWKGDGSLRVSEVVDPIVTHPQTGEAVLFCQAHMWHVSSLDPRTRSALSRLVAVDDLYHHCTFGDGSPLGDEDLLEVRRALETAAVRFPWQKHDVLLADNVLVAHGRSPFAGERRILVAMS